MYTNQILKKFKIITGLTFKEIWGLSGRAGYQDSRGQFDRYFVNPENPLFWQLKEEQLTDIFQQYIAENILKIGEEK